MDLVAGVFIVSFEDCLEAVYLTNLIRHSVQANYFWRNEKNQPANFPRRELRELISSKTSDFYAVCKDFWPVPVVKADAFQAIATILVEEIN